MPIRTGDFMRTLTLPRAIGLLLASSLAAAALSQPPTTLPAGRTPPVLRQPEYAGANQVPGDVLDPDAHQVIVLPSEPLDVNEDRTARSGGAIAKVAPETHRLPEGYVVAGRGAHIAKRGRWYEVRLDHVEGLPDSPPLRVLPNGRLNMLESVLSENSDRPFVVTGRVTEFYGQNYLILENLLEGTASVEPAAPKKGEKAAAAAAAPKIPTTGPAHEPTAEEVLKKMMQERPQRSLVLPQEKNIAGTQPSAEAPGTPEARETPRWPEGTLLMERTGRIIPGDPWWTFAFEDPTPTPREKPVSVLPSQLLETAIALSGGGTKGVVLIVSGELSVYKGANYLLLRKVLVRRDMGNFR